MPGLLAVVMLWQPQSSSPARSAGTLSAASQFHWASRSRIWRRRQRYRGVRRGLKPGHGPEQASRRRCVRLFRQRFASSFGNQGGEGGRRADYPCGCLAFGLTPAVCVPGCRRRVRPRDSASSRRVLPALHRDPSRTLQRVAGRHRQLWTTFGNRPFPFRGVVQVPGPWGCGSRPDG